VTASFISPLSVTVNRGRVEALLSGRDGPLAELLVGIAVRVESKAKMLCPVDTGRLRSSISHTVGRDDRGLWATVGTNVDYAMAVEYGTFRQRAQPYLRPALESIVRGGIR
jgi:hypothetical protein